MNTAITILRMLVRLCFAALLVLGIVFWTGHGLSLIPAHMIVGIILVVSLWLTSILAAVARAPLGFVALGLLWGALTIWFGVNQMSFLPGSAHWVVQVAHLLIGMVAAGLNERIGALAQTRTAVAG
ncbi:MAG: hypothetical protein JO293_05215 [Candidatus Eremiobacteraeota bacterium]|nr:hypothetical protein [Candidatus Eremiobacteraeota bacterium]MBV8281444.1 hypothetical protein [Candidatus Eremiobacteraeota bacterium]